MEIVERAEMSCNAEFWLFECKSFAFIMLNSEQDIEEIVHYSY
jgi:uncharacterized protein YhbP (UPF0306 family)